MFFDNFFKKKSSGSVAKDRLKLVLVTDRANCSPDLMEQMKKDIIDVISKYDAEIVIQHSTDKTEDYKEYSNVVEEVFLSLKEKIELANSKGINKIVIDPGIGFGKKREDNFRILNKIEEFYSLNCPIMVGVSRKSLLGVKADNNLLKDELSVAISYPLAQKGVDYLRVHNVKLHKAMLDLLTI